MNTNVKTRKNELAHKAQAFREDVQGRATQLLVEWVGDNAAREAVGRIMTAFAASAASARNPAQLYECTRQSIASCVAISALTGIMPSTGANALAYLIPRRPSKDKPSALCFELSHRGLQALARRCGNVMNAIPVSFKDKFEMQGSGDVVLTKLDFDNPPETMDELRGVVIVVKDITSGNMVASQFVSKSLIERRRDMSQGYHYALKNAYAQRTDPWHVWPVEMAMKTAMHYATSRGWCVIDDTSAVRALSMESSNQPTLSDPQGPRIENDGWPGDDDSSGGGGADSQGAIGNPDAPKSESQKLADDLGGGKASSGELFADPATSLTPKKFEQLRTSLQNVQDEAALTAVGNDIESSRVAGQLSREHNDELILLYDDRYKKVAKK